MLEMECISMKKKITISILFVIFSLFISLPSQAQTVVGDVTIAWDDESDNEDGFCIEYKMNADGTWTQMDSVDANITQYGPFSFAPADTYYFRIYAYNAIGNSGYSNTLSIIFGYPEPNAPHNLNLTPHSPDQINLSWDYDNDPPVDGFYIERKSGSASFQCIDTLELVTTYPDSGLSPSTSYFYRIIAFNSTGNSVPSEEAGATTTPVPETISKPGTPTGETSPVLDSSYTYTTSGATSNLGHTIEYSFNWGDGTSFSWSTSKSASHTWSSAGSRTVTVTARCQIHTDKSNTSDGLSVNVLAWPSPPAITGLTKHLQYQLKIEWSEIDNATGYNIYRDNEPFFIPDNAGGSNRIATNVNDIDP